VRHEEKAGGSRRGGPGPCAYLPGGPARGTYPESAGPGPRAGAEANLCHAGRSRGRERACAARAESEQRGGRAGVSESGAREGRA
jgi:hypothetical protein